MVNKSVVKGLGMVGNILLEIAPIPDAADENRRAVSILAQLPDNLAEGLRILELARQMFVEFNSKCPLVDLA